MDGYRLLIKPSAGKEFESLPRDDRRRIVARTEMFAEDPRPHGCEKLSGEDEYRLRQGDFRIVYQVDDDAWAVTTFKIGHRREVLRVP